MSHTPTTAARDQDKPDAVNFSITPGQKRCIVVLLGVMLALRIWIAIAVPFTDTTESRYAEIARKMVETGDWITPQFDYGVPFWGKPPLHTWISAAGIKLFGANQFGARAFILLAAITLSLSLYRWLKREKGQAYALTGTLIMVSSGLYFLAAATVMTDFIMLSGTSLCMIAFWDSVHHPANKHRSGYLFFIGLAIGLLAKGPAAFVLAAIPIGGWVLWKNKWLETWKNLPWISGTLLMLALTLPWYVFAERKTPGFLEYFILGEHWHRFLDSGWKGDLYGNGHAHPRGTIWIYALVTFLPWTPFLLVPLLRFKKIIAAFRNDDREWSSYLLCWAASPMVFFTMASNILPTYVITGIPAMAFLSVELWCMTDTAHARPSAYSKRFFATSTVAFFAICATAFAIFTVNPDLIAKRSQVSLVAKTQQLREQSTEPPGNLYYWRKRFYSAEFYTQGRAKKLETDAELHAILNNGEQDFLAVRSSSLESLPADCLGRFKNRGTIGKMTLLQERPILKSITQQP
ncbi:ArnT family glycosyltransferase [Oceaniferula flava]|uniref:ArnT family glycosyltransferase n=1 Tax=Oceaniferula flava TaxID=2800421 RepID=UPI002867B117|nr:glycosyltransferase family 39 protein [Oceaniferula flavus]